jgi:hypothetical protein
MAAMRSALRWLAAIGVALAGPNGAAEGAPAPPKADVVFARGTREVKWHFNDVFTYSRDRDVYLSSRVPGLILGWGTKVYSDAFVTLRGAHKNSVFFFGVPGDAQGFQLRDGAVWELHIRCDRARVPTFFGLKGFDGELVIDAPRGKGLERGSHRLPITIRIGETKVLRFAVADR